MGQDPPGTRGPPWDLWPPQLPAGLLHLGAGAAPHWHPVCAHPITQSPTRIGEGLWLSPRTPTPGPPTPGPGFPCVGPCPARCCPPSARKRPGQPPCQVPPPPPPAGAGTRGGCPPPRITDTLVHYSFMQLFLLFPHPSPKTRAPHQPPATPGLPRWARPHAVPTALPARRGHPTKGAAGGGLWGGANPSEAAPSTSQRLPAARRGAAPAPNGFQGAGPSRQLSIPGAFAAAQGGAGEGTGGWGGTGHPPAGWVSPRALCRSVPPGMPLPMQLLRLGTRRLLAPTAAPGAPPQPRHRRDRREQRRGKPPEGLSQAGSSR